MPSFRVLIAAAGLLFAAAAPAAPARPTPAKSTAGKPAPTGPVHIEFAHLLDEVRAERLEPWIEAFNDQQKDVRVTLVRRVVGAPAKQINLVTREEYARFMANKTSFKPLYEVMREARQPLRTSTLSPELTIGLSDSKGRLVALPLAFSTPVLYINKVAFRKAGLNPDAPPKNWADMQEAAGKLVDSGSLCPYTSSWPAWVHIDNLSAWNAGEVSDAKGNLVFNGMMQVKHIAMLSTWAKSRYFVYFGRRDEADRRFANGDCAMLTSSSSLFGAFAESAGFEPAVSSLPYHDDLRGAPQNTLADGASLWIANGMNAAETKGVAKFINYVLSPEVQINLTVAGGFLPMTPVARSVAASKLLANDLAALNVAYAELHGHNSAPLVRVSQDERLRLIVEEELENVWVNKKPAKEALDNAVARGRVVSVARPVPGAKRGK